ncbi:MAG: hypothetical protein EHM61_21110 [Acidobacteria bacterium]|nr:MAG: hypothetical protein EHM61_21110 [Acidobacteriota bacterium]
MTDQQRELLKRIFNSRYFATADSLRRILEYLCQRSESQEGGSIKEYDIAIHALGRPPSFDPKTDPIVRVNIATIRARLRAFFEHDSPDARLRLSIPKGQYRAVFEEVPKGRTYPGAGAAQFPALERFWHPYLTHAFPNNLVFTELLFYRDDQGTYVRNIYINEMQGGLEQLKHRLPDVQLDRFRPSFHFVSAGELHCLLKLTRLFENMGVEFNTKNSRFLAWNSLRDTNLILIGSSRTNPFIDSLQGENNFVLGPDRITNAAPRPGEEASYAGFRTRDGKLEKVTEYAVVTRRPALSSDCVVTSIAANHGRAVEGAGDFLTEESQVALLLQRLEAEEGAAGPSPHFQVLLRVDMIDFDEEVSRVEIVATRAIGGNERR